jgi:hypothetical protein
MWPRYLTLWPRRPLAAIPPKRWIVKAPGILLPQGSGSLHPGRLEHSEHGYLRACKHVRNRCEA